MSVFTEDIAICFLSALEAMKPTSLIGCQFFCNDPTVLQFFIDRKINVGLIVQKQKSLWMRKGFRSRKPRVKTSAENLRRLYDNLVPLSDEFHEIHHDEKKEQAAAVMCKGVEYSSKSSSKISLPLMHHKFFVMLNEQHQPIGAFLGSYNFSNHAKNNDELGVLLHGPLDLFNALLMEWKRLRTMSEPLDYVRKRIAKSTAGKGKLNKYGRIAT